jgi:hypothetical protein
MEQIHLHILQNKDERIVLLRIREVIMWLFGDLSYLPQIEKVNKTKDAVQYKILEDVWGQTTLKLRRPDLKLDKQWTNKFGEHICEEICMLMGKSFRKPAGIEHHNLDVETDDTMFEVKTQTFHTSGTAGEKILGTHFKYADVPVLVGKKLAILCLGGAEKVCREQYGNLPGKKCSPRKQILLDMYKSLQIEYIGATDLLKTLIPSCDSNCELIPHLLLQPGL